MSLQHGPGKWCPSCDLGTFSAHQSDIISFTAVHLNVGMQVMQSQPQRPVWRRGLPHWERERLSRSTAALEGVQQAPSCMVSFQLLRPLYCQAQGRSSGLQEEGGAFAFCKLLACVMHESAIPQRVKHAIRLQYALSIGE